MARKIIDLSLTLRDGMRGIRIEPALRYDPDGYNTSNLTLYSHAATHMDAPRHFVADGPTIDEVDLQKCVGPALIVDLTRKRPDSLITVEDMRPYAARIGPGARLLIRTDWDTHADLPDYRTHFPRISLELAEWLVGQAIWLLGVQTPSVASLHPEYRRELTDVHQTLLRAGVVIVESLANLSAIDGEDVYFVALPLRLDGCDGSPIRPIAIIED